MYQKNNLPEIYFKSSRENRLSSRLPDYTNTTTLYYMNRAINCCDDWENFLDIGASDGYYSVPLLSKFEKGTAVEMDNNENLTSLKKDFDNFTPIIGTVDNIKVDTKFDFILMADVFEHIPLTEINNFCSKLSTVQNIGGVIYILTPNPVFCGPATKSELFHTVNNHEHHGHQKHYLVKEIENMLSIHGYSLVFEACEESSFRQLVKRIIFGVSIRDNKYQKSKVYRMFSPILVYPIQLLLYALGFVSHKIELLKSKDNFEMMSQVLVFKKI